MALHTGTLHTFMDAYSQLRRAAENPNQIVKFTEITFLIMNLGFKFYKQLTLRDRC